MPDQEMKWGEVAPMLEQEAGVYLHGIRDFTTAGTALAMVGDAASNYTPGTQLTTTNDGYLVQFFNYINPQDIPMLIAPNRMAEIFGESRQGTWEQVFQTFKLTEQVGQVAAYGDGARGGTANANVEYVQRQNMLVQVFIEAGDLELARAGAGGFDMLGQRRIAQSNVLNKWTNRTYAYGVDGMPNYGVLTDPNLNPANTPTKGAGGTTWAQKATNKTDGALDIYQDFLAAYGRIQANAEGVLDADMDETTKLVFVIPPACRQYLKIKNTFGLSVEGMIKEAFPNSEVKTAPEMQAGGVNYLYAFVPELDGVRTVQLSFSERLRTHRVEFESSMMRQKCTSGAYGAFVARPVLVDQTTGI